MERSRLFCDPSQLEQCRDGKMAMKNKEGGGRRMYRVVRSRVSPVSASEWNQVEFVEDDACQFLDVTMRTGKCSF